MKVNQADGTVKDEIVLTDNLPSKITVDTVLNALSVGAGGLSTGDIDLNITTESEIWILVNIDQQPWRLWTGVPWSLGAWGTAAVYPAVDPVVTAYPALASPSISLYLSNYPPTEPTTLQEARQYRLPPVPGTTVTVFNTSAAVATVTIRVMRIWRAA